MLAVSSNVLLPALPDARIETRNEMRRLREKCTHDDGKARPARQWGEDPVESSQLPLDARIRRDRPTCLFPFVHTPMKPPTGTQR